MQSRTIRITAVIVGLSILVLLVISLIRIPITPWVGDRIRTAVKDRLDSDLEFTRVDVSLFPLSASVADVVFWHKGHRDRPPLAKMRRATAYMGVGSVISMLAGKP